MYMKADITAAKPARRPRRWPSTAVATAVIAALAVGWRSSRLEYIVAEEGIGYALGIAGSVMMLALLLYPVRKRVRAMRRMGSVAAWFRLHMLLGLAGPLAILYHANFRFGSLNSSVALCAMLLVAASGVVGRFIYSKIHIGLYGRRAEVADFLGDASRLRAALGVDLDQAPEVAERLRALEQAALMPHRRLGASTAAVATLSVTTRFARWTLARRARAILAAQAVAEHWPQAEKRRRLAVTRRHLAAYLEAIRRAAAFAFYERLFALWHVLHLPLFILLILTAVAHVFAVHAY